MYHTTCDGVAVTVADNPGTDADADLGCQSADEIHIQDGNPAYCGDPRSGDVYGVGNVNGSCFHACRANVPGSIAGAAGLYTTKSAKMTSPAPSVHTRKYCCPGTGSNTSEVPIPTVGFALEY